MWKKLAVTGVLVLLIPAYLVFAHALPVPSDTDCGGEERVLGERVGFCTEVAVSVMRPYYAGVLTLPVYKAGFDLDFVNRTFLPVLLGAIVLVWWRW